MSLPWVKIYVRLLDDDEFNRLPERARHTYLTSIPLAQKCDSDGALVLRTGPMTAVEIARKTGMPEKNQAIALAQLCDAGFLSRRDDGAYVVERFVEHQEKGSKDRVRKHREKKALQSAGDVTKSERFGNDHETPLKLESNGDVTLRGRYGNALDKDKEEDKDKDIACAASARAGDAVTDFVRWFVAAGIEIGPIAAHFDAELEIRRELDRSGSAAEALLKTYGRPECELRARRFLAAMQAAKLRGQPWIRTLSERWTWPEVSGIEAPAKASALRVVSPVSSPDLDAIPPPLDPNTADFAALFARRGAS